MDLGEAFVRAVGCNWMVCLAVWICYSARSTTDKILSIIFPITAFVAAGFEHSVANMYFIPTGLLLKAKLGLQVAELTWSNFFIGNLIPVTLGNIIGGVVFVGFAYWFAYLKGTSE